MGNMGKGKKSEKEGDDTLKLKAAQKPGTVETEPSIELKPFDSKKQKKIIELDTKEKEPAHEHGDFSKGKRTEMIPPARTKDSAGDKQDVKKATPKSKDIPILDEKKTLEDIQQPIKPVKKTDKKPGTKPKAQSDQTPTPKQIPEGTMLKSKLKSVKQDEKVESPLEKLKRLENAQPVEVEEPESEEEFVSTLPMYNIPSKREKTDLKEYDSPDKERQQKLQPEKDEPLPDWERLKKKPESKKDPNEIVLGRGTIPEKDGDDTLALKASQKPGTVDLEPSMKLKSFALKKQKKISEPGSQEKEPVHKQREVNKGKGTEDQKEPARTEAPAGDKKEVKTASQKRKDTPTLKDNMVPEDVKPLITPATKSDRKPGTKPQSQSEPKTTAKQAPEGTIIKPKLKSVKQAEIVESPLEKLKRLENAQPVEVEEPESEEEFVSSLPSYNI